MANTKYDAAEFRFEINEPFNITLSGRLRWALVKLITAGKTGCTTIASPAPRWSAYVRELRSMGVLIETIREKHCGDFPGTHARYRLSAMVQQVWGCGR